MTPRESLEIVKREFRSTGITKTDPMYYNATTTYNSPQPSYDYNQTAGMDARAGYTVPEYNNVTVPNVYTTAINI